MDSRTAAVWCTCATLLCGGAFSCRTEEEPELPDIHELWDHDRPRVTERRLDELLPRARASQQPAYLVELLSNLARTRIHQGRREDARATLDEAEALMMEHPSEQMRRSRVSWLLESGLYLRYLTRFELDDDPALPQRIEDALLDAYAAGIETQSDFYAIDAAHLLGLITLGDRRIEWNLAGLRLARSSEQPHARDWLGLLYEHTASAYHWRQRWPEALEISREGLA